MSHLTEEMFVTVWLTSTRSGELCPVLHVRTPVPPSTTLKENRFKLPSNHSCYVCVLMIWALASYVHLTGGSLTMFVFISSWLLDKGKHSRVRITNKILSIVFSAKSFNVLSHWQVVVLLPRLSDKLNKISIITSLLVSWVCHGHREGNMICYDKWLVT